MTTQSSNVEILYTDSMGKNKLMGKLEEHAKLYFEKLIPTVTMFNSTTWLEVDLNVLIEVKVYKMEY